MYSLRGSKIPGLVDIVGFTIVLLQQQVCFETSMLLFVQQCCLFFYFFRDGVCDGVYVL